MVEDDFERSSRVGLTFSLCGGWGGREEDEDGSVDGLAEAEESAETAGVVLVTDLEASEGGTPEEHVDVTVAETVDVFDGGRPGGGSGGTA